MGIETKLKELMDARQTLAKLKIEKESSYKAWLEANELLFSLVNGAANMVTDLETAIKDAVIADYSDSQNALYHIKTPYVGLQVKEMTRVDEYDTFEVMAWGVKHEGLCLKVDRTAFEATVRANPDAFLGMATVSKIPQVQIAQELEKVLKEGERK